MQRGEEGDGNAEREREKKDQGEGRGGEGRKEKKKVRGEAVQSDLIGQWGTACSPYLYVCVCVYLCLYI